MRRLAAGMAALALGCAPATGPEAKLWTVEDFLAARAADKDFGGWRTSELVTLEGQPIPFRRAPHVDVDALQGPGYGLTVFPAFSEGQPASFVITELWRDHPTPWVQPTWQLVRALVPDNPGAAPVAGTQSIFPNGPQATFYSPFWRATYVLAPDASRDTYRSAVGVMNARLPSAQGPVFYCVLAPADGGVAVAGGEARAVHPWLLAEDVGLDGGSPLAVRAPAMRTAWVDDAEVSVLAVGADRVSVDGQLPVESRLYTFVAGADGGLLPIPAVLPNDAFRSSFVRRYDVRVPPGGAVFVPEERAALRAALAARGVAVVSPAVDPSVGRAHLGAVITDTRCLAGDGGLTGCALLDSAAEIEALDRALVTASATTAAVAVTQVGARTSR
jgi:hypothetical protein